MHKFKFLTLSPGPANMRTGALMHRRNSAVGGVLNSEASIDLNQSRLVTFPPSVIFPLVQRVCVARAPKNLGVDEHRP